MYGEGLLRLGAGDYSSASEILDSVFRKNGQYIVLTWIGRQFRDERGGWEIEHSAIGMETLRRFTTTFDAAHGAIYLVPNEHVRELVPPPGQ